MKNIVTDLLIKFEEISHQREKPVRLVFRGKWKSSVQTTLIAARAGVVWPMKCICTNLFGSIVNFEVISSEVMTCTCFSWLTLCPQTDIYGFLYLEGRYISNRPSSQSRDTNFTFSKYSDRSRSLLTWISHTQWIFLGGSMKPSASWYGKMSSPSAAALITGGPHRGPCTNL